MQNIGKIVSTAESTMIDFRTGPIDYSEDDPELNAAPPEKRALMLREMTKERQIIPHMSHSIFGTNWICVVG
ncbi:MAG: hypothetical protein ACI9NT_002905 [Bacteroidia bacterium]|jgi:hypothetical protein